MFKHLTDQEKIHLAELLKFKSENKLAFYKPYPKQIEFHNAGLNNREKLLMAANQVGKSWCGAMEMAMHLTGRYPDWWEGFRFSRPINAWAAGVTAQTTRDTVQRLLVGRITELGTGAIPTIDIVDRKTASGIKDALDTVVVRHQNGGLSTLGFKSYNVGREKWQSETLDLIWFDEEPPLDVYTEGLTRTNTTGGRVYMTFTPLLGMSDVVKRFLANETPSMATVTMTIDDALHYTAEQRAGIIAAYSPHERDARTRGVPSLGAGAIYSVSERDFVVEPFDLKPHWRRCFGMDVGWNNTAVVWAAIDDDADTVYIYDCYKRGQMEPSQHASVIRSRGSWIPGVIDPASRGRAQADGKQLLQLYREQDLKIVEADNGVESGIYEVWQRLQHGRLKIFSTCVPLLEEYRLYRRDERGKVVKVDDHLMDALRYLIVSGVDVAENEQMLAASNAPLEAKAGAWQWL